MYSTGIDLGGSWTKLGLVSVNGAMLAEERLPAIPGEPLPQVFRCLRQDLERMARAQHLPYPPPGGVGVGAAAIVDHRTGWPARSISLTRRRVEWVSARQPSWTTGPAGSSSPARSIWRIAICAARPR